MSKKSKNVTRNECDFYPYFILRVIKNFSAIFIIKESK